MTPPAAAPAGPTGPAAGDVALPRAASSEAHPAAPQERATAERTGGVATVVAAPAASPVAGSAATFGGRALLVPADGDGHHGLPVGPGASGTAGGSSSGSAGAAPVGVDGTAVVRFSLAAGSRGALADDVVPASVVGDHDVAPD